MPRIAAIISARPVDDCRRLLKSMVESMEHERFYTSGTYSVPEMGIYAGWVAHQNSFAAGQVFFNERKDIALLFSGECFVDPETRIELFPGVFRILQERSVLVLDVIPSVTRRWQRKFSYLLNEEHRARRSAFYKTEHLRIVPVEEMLKIFSEYADTSGFKVEMHIAIKRHIVFYLALFLIKQGSVRSLT